MVNFVDVRKNNHFHVNQLQLIRKSADAVCCLLAELFCLIVWIRGVSIPSVLWHYWLSVRKVIRPGKKHNYVLSNAGLSNAPTKTGICTSVKSDFYFRFHSQWNTKSALPNFICTWAWCWSVNKCGHQSLITAKIGIRTSLKSANYFRFVSQAIGDEATTFLSRMQNFVKIGKELWT